MDYQKKMFWDGGRVAAVLKELEYNDSVKQSGLFSPPNYPVSTFHEFISAIYILRNAFASWETIVHFCDSSLLGVGEGKKKKKQ